MTTEQAIKHASLPDTLVHIRRVQTLICQFCQRLTMRGVFHDKTKLRDPEIQIFDTATERLADLHYGSNEYKQQLKEMKPALEHHYSTNRHHPEFWRDKGIAGMNLIDLTEMLIDWKAASERHKDGDIFASIRHNANRFGYGPELQQLLLNTAQALFTEEGDPVPEYLPDIREV